MAVTRRMSATMARGLALAGVAAAASTASVAMPHESHLRSYPVAGSAQAPLLAGLPGTTHAAPAPTPSVDLGRAPRTAHVEATAYLALRDRKAAWALLRHVSTPGDPAYHQYISAAQFNQLFGAPANAAGAVRKYFESFGITVGQSNRHEVVLSGTVAQMERALRVSFHRYGNGQPTAPDRWSEGISIAPASSPRPARNIASLISGYGGLDRRGNHITYSHAAVAPAAAPPDAFRDPGPCSNWWGEKLATWAPAVNGQAVPDVVCGYTPGQLESAYGVTSVLAGGNTGQGQTVAIVDAYASPTARSDTNYFSLLHQQAPLTPGQFREIMMSPRLRAGGGIDAQGWAMEEALDLEAVHTTAPGANILYVGATRPDDASLQAALYRIVNGQLANVITNSWGESSEPAAFMAQPYNDIFVQAGLEGISVLFASGDGGGLGMWGIPSTSWPASSPLVTAVGGTSLQVGPNGEYLGETGWGTQQQSLDGNAWGESYFAYGSGGGTSTLFGMPWYQAGVVPTSVSGGFRTVPDISLNADPSTGELIGMTFRYPDGSMGYGELRIGGTSASSPLLAGLVALSNNATGFEHGLLNPAIYRLAGSQYLHDVLPPSEPVAVVERQYDAGYSGSTSTYLDWLGQDAGLAVTPGWDNVTGNGSPAPGFVDALGH